ncbi:hypothetical protein GWK47_037027 [Chionoecetes opilio]|uniref:Uncharacterized protein n=1 Tax=Chionoecetes opilio TaxID=41210 RepID=A0A8J4YM21_CHIOP|nr:hypothetical protein GWK47_037027 [Chionoecetes opilio]
MKDEDKEFLRSQREDRGESSMAGIDLVTTKKVEKQVERGTRLKRLREREDSDIARLTERAEIPSQSSSSSSSPVSTTSSPAPTAQVLGMDIGSMAISKGTVHRARIAGREQAAEKIVELRNQEIPERLVLHWDGKLLPSLSGDTEDRIAVLLTGEDAPSSFLGSRQARIRLANVAAVVLKEVDEAGVGTRSSPSVSTPRLRTLAWCKRETVETSEDLVEFFATNDTASKLKDDALAFLKEALMSKNHPREDYEELLHLSYLFLGGEGPAKPFRRPGALHQARWMAKAIYCLKLQMLKSQLSLTGREKAGVERVDLFVALAAEQALRRHLWYVSEENAGLAFFDSRIDVEEKKQMVKALDKPASKKELKRLEGKKMTMSSSLSSFVTLKTRSFFQKLDADEGFLAKDPALWEEDDRFKDARKRALGLRVVNDAAERGIALVQLYLGSTKSAAQEKYLLQLVHHHRKLVGREKKEDLQKKAF